MIPSPVGSTDGQTQPYVDGRFLYEHVIIEAARRGTASSRLDRQVDGIIPPPVYRLPKAACPPVVCYSGPELVGRQVGG